ARAIALLIWVNKHLSTIKSTPQRPESAFALKIRLNDAFAENFTASLLLRRDAPHTYGVGIGKRAWQ
ncbi:MAG: hypothetical protein AAFQ04_09735, partial [Pseudomonadota bacterium]